MKKLLFCISFVVAPFLHAMDPNPIASILIRKELHRTGAKTPSDNINKNLKNTFFLDDTDKESVVIFKAIYNHESMHEYRPTETTDGRYILPATNYLEKNVQYFWDENRTYVEVKTNVQ